MRWRSFFHGNSQLEEALEATPIPLAFSFLNPGRLVDGELELVAPQPRWIDDTLKSCQHPGNLAVDPGAARITRQHVEEFVAELPLGHQHPAPEMDIVPAYHFWMLIRTPIADAAPPVMSADGPAHAITIAKIAGGINLRIGTNRDLIMYTGHIGYHVYGPYRGHHYALRACRLLLPLARRHGMQQIWITCNPDNRPSRRTCEALGGRYVDTVKLPADHALYAKGERHKCRYVVG